MIPYNVIMILKGEKEKKYTLTVTETQLKLICDCVEDCHRFMAGQMELDNCTIHLDTTHELWSELRKLQKYVTPFLVNKYGENNASYTWNGGSCSNDMQRKFIAKTYPIYREILHFLAVKNDCNNVYCSETLTFEEGGELPVIKEADEERKSN